MCYFVLERRNIIRGVGYGECLIYGISILILGYYYGEDSKNLKGFTRSVFNKLLGELWCINKYVLNLGYLFRDVNILNI